MVRDQRNGVSKNIPEVSATQSLAFSGQLATASPILERTLQDVNTRVESAHSKGMIFQANILEMLNNNRFASSDGESGNSIRPFLTASQLTKMCGFKWIVTESTPAQLNSLCRKLQEMSASSRMVAILRSGDAFHEGIGITLEDFRQINQQFMVAFCAIFHDKVIDATGKEQKHPHISRQRSVR